jgi:hypothetical protein
VLDVHGKVTGFPYDKRVVYVYKMARMGYILQYTHAEIGRALYHILYISGGEGIRTVTFHSICSHLYTEISADNNIIYIVK